MASAVGADSAAFQHRWHETRRERGIFDSNEQYIAWVCEHIGVHANPDSTRRAVLYFEQLAAPLMQEPRVDALPTLDSLKAAGVHLGLISDCSWDVPLLWPSCPLSRHIAKPVFSCEMGAKKPEAPIYEEALRRIGVTAAEAFFVGDGGSNELSGASAVGMKALLFRPEESDVFRPEAEEWSGAQIFALPDVFRLVGA